MDKFIWEYNLKKRCEVVTARFQLHRGNMYLTSRENVNGMPVICNSDREGGDCDASNVLITLPKKTNHKKVLLQLSSHQRGASNKPLPLSGSPYLSVVNDNYYMNIGQMVSDINQAQTTETVSPTPKPTKTSTPMKTPTNNSRSDYRY
jgi:Circadian oscillating protein COP23